MAALPSYSSPAPAIESDYFDEPPSYAGSVYSRRSSVPPPIYSPSPRLSERVIRTSSEARSASSEDYVYRSKHIAVKLGPKLWGTSIPVYSNGAYLEGSIALSGDLKGLSSVCIALEGTVTNTYSERGLITGSTSIDVLRQSSCLTTPVSGEWTDEQPFSLALSSPAMGRQTPLPPSSIIYHPGITCAVKYSLKVTAIRRGLRRNDRLKIPFMYLPRTFARGPLLSRIPNVVNESNQLGFSLGLQDVRTIPLKACGKNRSLDNAPTVVLTLPSVLSFASYDTFPLTLNIISPQNPAVAKLLLSAAKIYLIKRTRTWLNGGRTSSKNESLGGIAHVVHTDEERNGITVVSYELRAARPQMSWAVDGVAEQQYYIRVTVSPPTSAAAHIPNYECEQLTEITTDAYESLEREVAESGGTPSPAIGTLGVDSPNSSVEGSCLALRTFR